MGSSVKDNNNILTTNQWSAGEQQNNLTGISINQGSATVQLSSDDPYLGNKSIQILKPAGQDTWTYIRIVYEITSDLIGKTFTAKCHLKENINHYIALTVLASDGTSETSVSSTSTSSGGEYQTLTVTSTIPAGTTSLILRVQPAKQPVSDLIAFIDNIYLSID